MTYGFAVQPTAWTSFDPHGCEWATDMNHAYAIVWMVPSSGNAVRWCRATEITDAIADLVFGI
jgi:hypothetical protein